MAIIVKKPPSRGGFLVGIDGAVPTGDCAILSGKDFRTRSRICADVIRKSVVAFVVTPVGADVPELFPGAGMVTV